MVVTGGRSGVMEAASKGAHEAAARRSGSCPGADRREANQWVSIAVPTGMGEARNALVVRAADALVAIRRRLGDPVGDRPRPQDRQARGGDRPQARGRSTASRPRPSRHGGPAYTRPIQSEARLTSTRCRAYAARGPAASTCRATRAGRGPIRLREAIGESARTRHPRSDRRHRRRARADAVAAGAALRPRPGARGGPGSSWNGASQGNHVARLALAHLGDEVWSSATAHSSTIDGLIISGLSPRFRAARARPGAEDRPLRHARGARPGPHRDAGSCGRARHVADLLRRRRRRGGARGGRPLARRPARRRRGLGRPPCVPSRPASPRPRRGGGSRHLEHPQDRREPHAVRDGARERRPDRGPPRRPRRNADPSRPVRTRFWPGRSTPPAG